MKTRPLMHPVLHLQYLCNNVVCSVPALFLLLRRLSTAVVVSNVGLAVGVKLIGVVLALTGSLSLSAAVVLDVGTLVVVAGLGMVPLASQAFTRDTVVTR